MWGWSQSGSWFISGRHLGLVFSSTIQMYPSLKRTELSKSSTLTRATKRLLILFLIFQTGPTDIGSLGSKVRSGKVWLLVQMKGVLLASLDAAIDSQMSFYFWIKSSARRAFGGCLGSKRRWKTWYSAISHGELRISFDPWISEWGNPPESLI